jgi:hypothetical protein
VQSVLAHNLMSPETASMVTVGQYPASLNAASVQRVADLMANFGILSSTIPVQTMVLH